MKQVRAGAARGWRQFAVLGATLIAILATGGVAQATTNINVDDGWHNFITAGGVGGASTAGPWAFTSTSVAKVTVTDAFCHGDQFHVYDGDVLLGDTSDVPTEFPACPFQLFFPADARADAALADETFSQGVFYVAPGKHAIEFAVKVLWGDTSTGTGAYLRADSVTVTKNDCKHGGWENYGTLFKNQGACLSTVG